MDWIDTLALWIGYASLGTALVAVCSFLAYSIVEEWRKRRVGR